MNNALRRTIVQQFGHPRGLVGRLAGWIMSKRSSNLERIEMTLDHLNIQHRDQILEIGFGPGVGINGAAARAAEGHVIGVDHSRLMLRKASRRNRRAIAAGQVRLICSPIERGPLDKSHFDKIFGINVHMFWRDKARVCRYLAQHLKAGGLLALTFQPRNPGASRSDALRAGQDLEQHFKAAGLVNIRSELFQLQPVDAVCVTAEKVTD